MNKKMLFIGGLSLLTGLGSCIIEHAANNASKSEKDKSIVVDSCNVCMFTNTSVTSKLNSVINAIRHSPCNKGRDFDAELSSIIAASAQSDAVKMTMIDSVAVAILSSASKDINDGRATIEGAIVALKNLQ